jgi:hypothetical protein
MAVSLSLTVSSCAGSADTGATTDVKAVVDAARGVIETPLDAYLPTEAQQNLFAYAVEIKAAGCAAARGVSYTPIKRQNLPADNEFGVWQMSHATRYGYGVQEDPTGAALSERESAMSEAEKQVVYDCMIRPEMSEVKYPSSGLAKMPFMREVTSKRPIDTSLGKKVVNEWRDCLKKADITPPGEPKEFEEYDWTPPEVGGMKPEAQLQTAVADVKCKDQVRLVQREADIQAGMEHKVIAEHGPELAGFRDTWRGRLAAAQKVIDGYHGA